MLFDDILPTQAQEELAGRGVCHDGHSTQSVEQSAVGVPGLGVRRSFLRAPVCRERVEDERVIDPLAVDAMEAVADLFFRSHLLALWKQSTV